MNATTLKPHPLADVVRKMFTDEFCELVADIKQHGQREPITLYEGKVLDGRHRACACAELSIEPKTVTFTGTAAEAKALVMSLNVHRRHLTLEQKHRIINAELHRDSMQSDRTIAKAAKVDHKTVAKVRDAAEAGGEIPHHKKRVGVDGVAQPATKPRPTLADPTPPAPKHDHVTTFDFARRECDRIVDKLRRYAPPWRAELLRALAAALTECAHQTDAAVPDEPEHPHHDVEVAYDPVRDALTTAAITV